MKKLKIVLAAAALVVAGSLSAQTVADLSAKLTEAADAAKAKNFAAAIPIFEEIIDKGLDIEGAETFVAQAKQLLPTAVFQVGGSAFQGGRLDDALASFTKAAELAELYGNVQVLNNARTWIGRTVLKQGADAFNAKDYANAAAIFQKGYDGNPNDTTVALNLAMSYSGLKDFAKSGEIYKNIIALGEQDERFAEAATTARENFSLDVLEWALESAKAGDYQTAVDATENLLAVIPADPAANLTRLQAYNSMKNYAKVIELGDAAAEAQTDEENRSTVNFLVAAAYQNRENYAKAIEYYGKVNAGGNVAAAKAQITELQKVVK